MRELCLFADTSAADGQRVLDAWNAMATRAGLPKVRLMTKARQMNLRGRIREVGIAGMLEAIARVEASAFCCGDNDRGWKADLDFILQPKSLAKLLEHGYQMRRRPSRHEESVNGAAILLAQLDAVPMLEGNVQEGRIVHEAD